MSKIELPNVTGGYNLSTINNNFQKIEDALNEEVLYRKGYTGEPNEMQTNLDMNGNKILNVVTGTSPSDLATRGYVDEEIAEERVYVDQQLGLVNSELDTKYDKTGGPVFGDINLNGHKLIGASEVQTSKTSTSILEINGVPVVPGNSVIDPYNGTREALRRSYAEAGYNLVDGSFQVGFTLVNANDVALDEATGKAFSGAAGTYPARTPTSGFVDRSPLAAGAGVVRAGRFALRDFVSVKDYGHVGDGVTDDTAAFASARADSVNVYVPSPDVAYVINSDFDGNFFGDSDVIFRGSGLITYTNTTRTYEPQKFRCIAHRGYAGSVAENTLAAFSTAIRNGADGIELDAQITSDGVAVVYHDATLDAQTNGSGTVSSNTFATINALTYDKLAGTPLADSRIPTLNSILSLAVRSNTPVFLEIKAYRTIDDIDIILNSIVATRANDIVNLLVNSFSDLARIRASTNLLAGVIPITILYANQHTWKDKYIEARALGGYYEFSMYHVNISGGGAGMVKKINKYSRLSAYMLKNSGATNPDANAAQIALKMRSLGVNSIVSDQNVNWG